MANNLNLSALHDSILDAIRAQFPDLQTVEDYDADRKNLQVPAVLLELMDMEGAPDEDPGTGQLPVVTKWAARVVFAFHQGNVKREIRDLSAALGVLVHQNRWGQPVSPALVTVIGPDAFDPAFDKFEVWAVEWDQKVDLGANIWAGEGVTPQTVSIGFAPDIGPGNEANYSDVSGGDE